MLKYENRETTNHFINYQGYHPSQEDEMALAHRGPGAGQDGEWGHGGYTSTTTRTIVQTTHQKKSAVTTEVRNNI